MCKPELQSFKMGRIGLKLTPEEPPIFLKESKQEPEVLFKKKK
jgi:hypothetical protein